MARTRSRWCSLALAALAGALAAPAPVLAQDDVEALCAAQLSPAASAECRLVAAAAAVIQPRLGAALFGGNPVPGTASTLGMRLGSLPRMSLAFRVTGAPATLPPILDRTTPGSDRTLLPGFAADGAVGLLTGFSPLPTVGGVLSVDLIGRIGYVPLSGDAGFHDAGVFGWAVGARVGAVRESFTLPGVALTTTYGRIGRTAFGDPVSATTDGFFEGAVSDLRLGLAATKRLGLVGLTGGVAWNRYAGDLRLGFRETTGAFQVVDAGEAVHERWSGHVSASWTLLIFHAAAEAGIQETVVPEGLPAAVDIDPVGWFAGVAFRVSI